MPADAPRPSRGHDSGPAGPTGGQPTLDVKELFQAAVAQVYKDDHALLGTTERVLVGRLLIYMDRLLEETPGDGLHVDLDFERAGRDIKSLHQYGTPGALRRKIVPDIVVHRRAHNGPSDNLLAVEAKISEGTAGWLHDRAKLAVLTGNAECALAHRRYLRLPGDRPSPQDDPAPARVALPQDMHPYRLGVWACLLPGGPDLRWFERPDTHR